MANNTKLKPRPTPSSSLSQPAPISLVSLPPKRKEELGSNENGQPSGQQPFLPATALPASIADTQQSEYHSVCEVCRTVVGFWDEETGSFTLKHLEAHRWTCSARGQSSSDPVYAPENPVDTLAHLPTQRRRAKRTEKERINYLKKDPYVSQFETNRVLCASCNKWIRLRPNSTYCSTPWDAHRKSCLAKKVKNVNAGERRYPFIHDFDAESVLYNICDTGLSVDPGNHQQAVQKRARNQAACQKKLTPTLPLNEPIFPEPVSVPPLTAQHMAVVIGPPNSISGVQQLPHSVSHVSPATIFAQRNDTQPRNHTSDHHPFLGFSPSSHAPTHESQRRNAEKRAATLSADYLSKAEPTRPLSQKWVQLHQNPYYAYPWLQHRGECLERHAFDDPSFQPSRAHNGHDDHQRTSNMVMGIQQSPTIFVESSTSEANYYLTFAENINSPAPSNVYYEAIAHGICESSPAPANYCMPVYQGGNSHTFTSTYHGHQSLFGNDVQSSYHLGGPTVESTMQSPTVTPTSTYVTHNEVADRPAFTNAYIAQGYGNSLTSVYNSEPRTQFSGINNVQSSYNPDNATVLAQSLTMAVEIPTSANYYLAPGENTIKYSRVSDSNIMKWRCNLRGCKYVSRSKRDMERHCSNLSHGGRREHKCEYCRKVFAREDTLTRHAKETRCRSRQA